MLEVINNCKYSNTDLVRSDFTSLGGDELSLTAELITCSDLRRAGGL